MSALRRNSEKRRGYLYEIKKTFDLAIEGFSKKISMQMCGVRWEITEELNADDLRRERIPDFVYEVVEFLFEHSKFQGTATELLAAVGNTELKPNIASKYLTRY